jgi:hypothetical protein
MMGFIHSMMVRINKAQTVRIKVKVPRILSKCALMTSNAYDRFSKTYFLTKFNFNEGNQSLQVSSNNPFHRSA